MGSRVESEAFTGIAPAGRWMRAFGGATLVLLVMAWLSSPAAARQLASNDKPAYLVLVNANNRTSTADGDLVEMVKGLYLKKLGDWPNGHPATVLARPPEDPAHRAFSRLILRMDRSALDDHWLQLAADGVQAPEVVQEARDLVRLIAQDENAFGVVAEGDIKKLPAKVRVLFRFTPPDSAPPVDLEATPEIALLHDFMISNPERVRSVVTDFNRRTKERRFQTGEVALIDGYQVLLRYADMYVVRMSYIWNRSDDDSKLTDDYLVQFGGSDFNIVERVTEE